MVLAYVWLSGCQSYPDGAISVVPTYTPIPQGYHRPPGDHYGKLPVNGTIREFITHVPPDYQPGVQMPLVINLHGRGGSMYEQEMISHMNTKADEEGFIVVSPQALGQPSTWWPAPGPKGQEDLEFFEELISTLKSQHSIDPTRIYVTGFSNGGAMANRLACTMSEKIAAIASVAGAHPQMETCEPTLPVAVLVIHGTDDPIIPYEGDGDYLPSIPAWIAAWAQRNQCELTPVVDHAHGTVNRESWGDCAGNASVMSYTIDGGGHVWPGSGFGPGPYLDGPAPDVYATDIIWDFFEANAKILINTE